MSKAFRAFEAQTRHYFHALVFLEEARAKDGPVARLAYRRNPRSGVLTAWVLWEGDKQGGRKVYKAIAGGYGYDKATSAFQKIGAQVVGHDNDGNAPRHGPRAEVEFWEALYDAEAAGDWRRSLEKAGFLVYVAS